MGHTELAHLSGGYRVTAKFDNVGDLKVGAPLSIAGVRIGSVDLIRYDPAAAKAVITLRVTSNTMQVPIDSAASIRSIGLVGGKQVIISPGGSAEFLADGSEILQTSSVQALETLIQRSMNAAKDHMAKHRPPSPRHAAQARYSIPLGWALEDSSTWRSSPSRDARLKTPRSG